MLVSIILLLQCDKKMYLDYGAPINFIGATARAFLRRFAVRDKYTSDRFAFASALLIPQLRAVSRVSFGLRDVDSIIRAHVIYQARA